MEPLTDGGASEGEEIRALLLLEGTRGVGLASLRALVSAFGSARRAILAGPAARGRVLRRRTAPPPPELVALVDAGLESADRLGIVMRSWGGRGYPPTLLGLHDPPPVLFLRGRTELLDEPRVAVVGARRATARGRAVAERLGAALAATGFVSVSGMALGIDGAVHRGSLGAGGGTVAVLGTGADRAYPRAHLGLFRDICDRGLVVSEFLPGTPALAHHFPRRNRILAALGEAVTVVEAGRRSGALITVDHALDLGIDVWAVPGPIDVASCRGSNALLEDGARPLASVGRFTAALGGSGLGRSAPSAPELPREARRVLGLLDGDPLGVDELARLGGLPIGRVLALVTELETLGLVHRLSGMRFRRAA